MMDEILEYMIAEKWKTDAKQNRKLELLNLARKSRENVDVSHKIGGLLIYNQLIDELLKDIIEYSSVTGLTTHIQKNTRRKHMMSQSLQVETRRELKLKN